MSKILPLVRLKSSIGRHQVILCLKSANKVLFLLLPFAVLYSIIKSMKLQRTPFKDYPPFVSCKCIYRCMLSKTRSCFWFPCKLMSGFGVTNLIDGKRPAASFSPVPSILHFIFLAWKDIFINMKSKIWGFFSGAVFCIATVLFHYIVFVGEILSVFLRRSR